MSAYAAFGSHWKLDPELRARKRVRFHNYDSLKVVGADSCSDKPSNAET